MNIERLYDIYKAHPQVTTDSRKITEGTIFFALKGERFDGNQYAMQAIEKGAAFAVIDDPDLPSHQQLIKVEHVLETLQQLANYHRNQFSIPVIGITGSNGKTTTKELVSSVLSTTYPTHFTQGNFNNHIGVPLTLLAMPLETEVAVIEMGANHVGEIAALSAIADPSHGLITNIGSAHLEGFGGIEGVKKGKSELYRHLAKRDGIAFINMEEDFLDDLSFDVERKIRYKSIQKWTGEETYYSTQIVTEKPFVEVAFETETKEQIRIQSNLIGYYNYKNIMTAITIGKYFKVPDQAIKTAVETYVPKNNRSEWVYRDSNTILLDAYNANPSSMSAAIRFFSAIDNPKKVAILGDMLELGEESVQAHQDIIKLAQELKIEQIIGVGPIFYEIAEKFNLLRFKDVSALKEWFQKQTFENTHFLIKGSRGIKLEQVLQEKE